MRVTTALAVLVLCASTEAAATCSRNAHGVFEDLACAAEASAKADKELNEVYQRLLPKLDEETQRKLRTSQRAWLAYRDATSAFVYSVEGDGSAGRMIAANQREQATMARIKELRSWLR
jgi:uncharacterized protein YecT (DUF1311 family)